MLILGAEIGLVIYGLYALIKGEFSLGKDKKLVGGGARLCGALCLVPLPLSFFVGFGLGFALSLKGLSPEQIQANYSSLGAIIELVILLIVVIAVFSLGTLLYNKQAASIEPADVVDDNF